MNFKILFLTLWTSIVFCQIPLDHVYQLDQFNDKLTINDVIELDKQLKFNIPFEIESFKYLKDKQANWIKIDVPKQFDLQYLSIENALFKELNFYILKGGKTINPVSLKKNKEYRYPSIRIYPENTPCKIFIRSKDALSNVTEFNIKTYNQNNFHISTQKNYFIIGAYFFGLSVLIISLSIFSLYKREYIVLFYIFHLITFNIGYIINTGILNQWLLRNSTIIGCNFEHISFFVSILTFSEFFRKFYPYNNKSKFCKKILLLITISSIIGIIYGLLDIILDNTLNVEIYAQLVLNTYIFLGVIVHLFLAFHRLIPIYLFIGFLLPLISFVVNIDIIAKYIFNHEKSIFFSFQSIYLTLIIIQVIIFTFYVLKQSIDGEFRAIGLAKENNQLKINFDEELAKQQEEHQNALLNDVHDSFGGYIEALKLTLINKNIKDHTIEDILDSFTKDYRLLLNSLYIPNIDAKNFVSAIKEYCDKMNNISAIEINFKTEESNFIEIPQNIAKFVYKAASELTTNAIKHSQGTKIDISLLIDYKDLVLEVKDNGIGFIKEQIKPTSFGITGIKKRALTFNGSFEIISSHEKGSQLKLKIPIPETLEN